MAVSENLASELKELKQSIQKVITQIETIENSIPLTNDADEKKSLKDKEKQLRDKENQLRDELKQLREKDLFLLGKNQGMLF